MARLVLANQATSAKRRVYFDCRDVTDGITPETGEAGGQPQVSSDGASWTNTGIGTLTAIGNGRYYADLTQTLVATAGTVIETRYKSANTAETPGDSVQVVAFDPDDQNALGLGSLDGHTPQSGDCFARLGAPAGASVSADVAAVKGDTAAILLDTAELQADWANGGRLDLLIDAILEDTGTTLPATLTTISGQTALIGSASATVAGPLISATEIQVVQSDDYNNSDGRALSFSGVFSTATISGATVSFVVESLAGVDLITTTGTVVTATGTQLVRVELTSAQVATLTTPGESYRFQCRLTLSGSSRKITVASGTANVIRSLF